MKIRSSATTLMQTFWAFFFAMMLLQPLAAGEDLHSSVCVDGSMDTTFLVSANMPENRELFPQLVPDREAKPTVLQWVPATDLRRTMTVIGKFHGHEIVDIAYHSENPARQAKSEPFAMKVLAYRTGPEGSAPLRPFFIQPGDQVRWYEQAFESTGDKPFSLIVSRTWDGNGVMFSVFTFRFDEHGAWIEEIITGGRKMKNKTTTFTPAGNIKEMTEVEN